MTTLSEPLADSAARAAGRAAGGPAVLLNTFDDLYSSVYRILDDAKASHDLVKLYKGSHASDNPHPSVLDFGSFFYRTRQGLLAYTCSARRSGTADSGDLDAYDHEHRPRISMRAVLDQLTAASRRPGESDAAFLRYLMTRTHALGAYRGGSSGYDDEARAAAAAHFNALAVPATPSQVMIFGGGAKGAFLAFCAALMCRRHHETLERAGGLLLVPEGYYQSLRLIPPIFGGMINTVRDLSGETIQEWLSQTAGQAHRAIYVPLVNNADGQVLTRQRAISIARAVLGHNAVCPDRPVYVLADDVYAGSYLSPDLEPTPAAAITGAVLGDSGLGRMSDWTFTVVTPSKTYALPTARVAFATTTSPALLEATGHYRTVFSLGRIPQAMELTAAAALCLTPQAWIDNWNTRYRKRLQALADRLGAINAETGMEAFHIDMPAGGWNVPLRISPALFPGRLTSSVDAFAILLHYQRGTRSSGIAMLPGELFGHRTYERGFVLRGTAAASSSELEEFTTRLADMARLLRGPGGAASVEYALSRARAVCDVSAILAHSPY